MATQPLDTAKVYALTAAGACSVTLTQGEKSITWPALEEGGQTSFIVPAGATVSISDTTALLSPLPANFKGALVAGVSRIGGEHILPAQADAQGHCVLPMRHARWHLLAPEVRTCTATPSGNGLAHAMQLLLTPAEALPTGWLHGVEWVGGEPSMPAGYSYIVTLVQVAPTRILATLNLPFSPLS